MEWTADVSTGEWLRERNGNQYRRAAWVQENNRWRLDRGGWIAAQAARTAAHTWLWRVGRGVSTLRPRSTPFAVSTG